MTDINIIYTSRSSVSVKKFVWEKSSYTACIRIIEESACGILSLMCHYCHLIIHE